MNPEICIPKISCEIKRDFIFKIFSKLKIGYIERIIEIPIHKDPRFKRIIVKIKWDDLNSQSVYIKNRLIQNQPVNIVYDMPWYWKIVANHPQK